MLRNILYCLGFRGVLVCSILWEEGRYVSVCLVSNFEKFPMHLTTHPVMSVQNVFDACGCLTDNRPVV